MRGYFCRPIHLFLIITPLLYGTSLFSGPKDNVSAVDLDLLHEYKKTFRPAPVVNQCLGTCYLVSSLNYLELELSKKLGRDVSISTVDFLENFLEARFLERYLDQVFYHSALSPSSLAYSDIFSEGNFHSIIAQLVKSGMVVHPRSTELDLMMERKQIIDFFDKLGNLIDSFRGEISQSEGRFLEAHLSRYKDLVKRTVETISEFNDNLLPTSFSIMLENRNLNELISKLEFEGERDLYKLIHLYSSIGHTFLSLESFIDLELRILKDELPSKQSTLKIMRISEELSELKNETFLFEKSIRAKFLEKVNIFKKEYFEGLKYERVGKMRLEFSKKPGPPNISNLSTKLVSDLNSVAEVLEAKGPVLFGYLFQRRSYEKLAGFHGLQATPDEQYQKLKAEVGRHQVLVVDTIKDKQGETIYLVIKNSWGKGHGFHGYNFFHRSMVDFAVKIEFLDMSQFDISRVADVSAPLDEKEKSCGASVQKIIIFP